MTNIAIALCSGFIVTLLLGPVGFSLANERSNRDKTRYEPLDPSDPNFLVPKESRDARFLCARVEFAQVDLLGSVAAIAEAQESAWGILRAVPREA